MMKFSAYPIFLKKKNLNCVIWPLIVAVSHHPPPGRLEATRASASSSRWDRAPRAPRSRSATGWASSGWRTSAAVVVSETSRLPRLGGASKVVKREYRRVHETMHGAD